MERATEKQVTYLRDLIETARELVPGRADYPGDYQVRKYGPAPRDNDDALQTWRRTARGNKASDRCEFAGVLNGYLNGLNPDEMTKAEASRTIDQLRGGWVTMALETHFD